MTRLFGHYRDLLPDGVEVEVPSGATVADLARKLAALDARLEGVERHCRAAINEEYTHAQAILHDGDEVAFIPPMSGG